MPLATTPRRISPEEALELLDQALAYYTPEPQPVPRETAAVPVRPWFDYYEAA